MVVSTHQTMEVYDFLSGTPDILEHKGLIGLKCRLYWKVSMSESMANGTGAHIESSQSFTHLAGAVLRRLRQFITPSIHAQAVSEAC